MTIETEQPVTGRRIAWIAPEWRTLDLSETAMHPGGGGDGGFRRDCTLS